MPHRRVPQANRRFAKSMRQSMTNAEMRLWQHLKKPGLEGLRCRRQCPIGPYIVDFFCPEKMLIVEVDGDQNGYDSEQCADGAGTAWPTAKGYSVLRFWNTEIFENIEGVCEAILAVSNGKRIG
jgi:very-short-patch-repair endonuclease